MFINKFFVNFNKVMLNFFPAVISVFFAQLFFYFDLNAETFSNIGCKVSAY